MHNLPIFIGSNLKNIDEDMLIIKKGDFKLKIGNIRATIKKATAYITLRPRPLICIKGFYHGRFPSPKDLQQKKILHIKDFKPVRVELSSFQASKEEFPKIHLTVPKYLESKDTKIDKMYFFVLNFLDSRGYALRQNNNIYPGRTSIKCGNWQITFDKKPNFNDIRKTLNQTKGFAITHIGKIEKCDKKYFRAKDTHFLIESLFWFLSFCCSRFIGIPIQWGFYRKHLVWKSYINHPVSPWQQNLHPWFPENKPQCLKQLLPRFSQKLLDPLWEKTFKISIKWLIQSQEKPLSIGDINLVKSALNILSQSFFRHDRSCNIRKLITECKIPKDLSHYGIYSNDIKLLNNFKPNILPFKISHSTDIQKLLYLSIWFLELSILYILNYTGSYRNRMRFFTKNLPYKEAEMVPWVL